MLGVVLGSLCTLISSVNLTLLWKGSLLKTISSTDSFWSSFNMRDKYLAKLIQKKGEEEDAQAAGEKVLPGRGRCGRDRTGHCPAAGLERESWDSPA